MTRIPADSPITARRTSLLGAPRHLIIVLGLAALCVGQSGCERGAEEGPAVSEDAGQVAVPDTPDSDAAEQPTAKVDAGSDSEAPEQDDSWPWTVPAGWQFDPEPRRMRLATYLVEDPGGQVEVAMTRFPGQVGGRLANVNRWRGQMGLAPITDGELGSTLDEFSAPGFEGYQVRIDSDAGVMLAAGVFDEALDQTWFVRATISGPTAADRLQDDFFGVARSIAGADE